MLAAAASPPIGRFWTMVFFETFFGKGVVQASGRSTATLGNPFHLATPGIGIKMYPSGYHLHHVFEATLELVKKHDIKPNR